MAAGAPTVIMSHTWTAPGPLESLPSSLPALFKRQKQQNGSDAKLHRRHQIATTCQFFTQLESGSNCGPTLHLDADDKRPKRERRTRRVHFQVVQWEQRPGGRARPSTYVILKRGPAQRSDEKPSAGTAFINESALSEIVQSNSGSSDKEPYLLRRPPPGLGLPKGFDELKGRICPGRCWRSLWAIPGEIGGWAAGLLRVRRTNGEEEDFQRARGVKEKEESTDFYTATDGRATPPTPTRWQQEPCGADVAGNVSEVQVLKFQKLFRSPTHITDDFCSFIMVKVAISFFFFSMESETVIWLHHQSDGTTHPHCGFFF